MSFSPTAEVFEEPELDFGAGRHVDIRFGIMTLGPLDVESADAPHSIQAGLVGTPETVEGARQWLLRCRENVPGKQSRQPSLFPRFPGFANDVGYRATLAASPELDRTIPARVFEEIAQGDDANTIIREAVRLVIDEFTYLVENTGAQVLVCAVPAPIEALMDPDQRPPVKNPTEPLLNFHDLLKAEAMRLRRPVQLILPGTYNPRAARKLKVREQVRPLQDEATRAWNFHTALYYKAGGRPWRLVRDSSALKTCYVGISFYHSLDRSRVLTSMAQVFDERGEGLVVRGGTALLTKDDRTAHLVAEDAEQLLDEALKAYSEVHKHRPARVVVHKTSSFSPEEIKGCEAACEAERISILDCLSLTRDSEIRLFRQGRYPPLRGTFMQLDNHLFLLSTRGSVDFYATYPGLYIPRPLLFRCERVDTTPRQLAKEILALTKMNWNDTQFDGASPITVTAAQRVGAILKYVPPGEYFAPRYSYYM